MYKDRIRSVLSPAEKRIFARLRTPQKIQDYLDKIPVNFELSGETYMSPRRMLRERAAHCFEGALFAAAVLAYHGQKPLLLDLKTSAEDEDHVVALFRANGRWGAISKTNHAVLRYRDPVYKNVRELAMSYFHEYFMRSGKKTMRSYSLPFDLSKFSPETWITAGQNLDTLAAKLDFSKHIPIATAKQLRALRRATPFEIATVEATEWK